MLSKRARLWLGIIAATSLMSLAVSCNPKTEEPPPKPEGTTYNSKNDEGTISGKISYSGTAPAPIKIQTDADDNCTKASPNLMNEVWVVKDGKMANTFVYIKDGALTDGTKVGDYAWPVPTTAAVLDQNGCHYKPH